MRFYIPEAFDIPYKIRQNKTKTDKKKRPSFRAFKMHRSLDLLDLTAPADEDPSL